MSLVQTLKENFSFLRYLEHEKLKSIRINGRVIDLGAKSEDERYFKYIQKDNIEKIDFCDIEPKSPRVIKLNLEQPFPVGEEIYDHVLYFNVLEHIYNYRNLVNESYRILKCGGEAHCIVPFMWKYHGDPDDFNRFTHTALYRKFSEAGFLKVEVLPIGGGFWTLIASLFSQKVKIWWIKYLIIRLFLAVGSMEEKLVGKKSSYALAYIVRAIK